MASEDLHSTIGNISSKAKSFSSQMKTFYSQSFDSQCAIFGRLIKVRDETKRGGMVYVNAILPVLTSLIRSLYHFFENCTDLDYEEWIDSIAYMDEQLTEYTQCCTALENIHTDIIASLKEQSVEASGVSRELKYLIEYHKDQEKQLTELASSKRKVAIGLALVPLVNIIATPSLLKRSEEVDSQALKTAQQRSFCVHAEAMLRTFLIPALEDFREALSSENSLIWVLQHQLTGIQKGIGKAKMSNSWKMHYRLARSKATTMKEYCQTFNSVVPEIRSAFLFFPYLAEDQDYVNSWMQQKNVEVHEMYREYSMTSRLREMLKLFSTK